LLLTWFKVSSLFIILPLIIGALWNLTRLVCL
jgi:flagellar biogenesis protein FliO